MRTLPIGLGDVKQGGMTLRPVRIPHIEFAIQNFRPDAFDFANTHFAPRPGIARVLPPGADETALREAIATRYRATVDHVGVFAGCTGALAAAALTRTGTIAVETPGFEPTRALWSLAGRDTIAFDRSRHPHDLVAALPDEASLLCWTSPANPGADVARLDALGDLADALAARGATLLVNEIYLDYVGAPPGLSAFGLRPNIAVASSLTKAWGRGDLRIGWLVGPPDLVASARTARFVTSGPAPAPSIALALDEVVRAEAILSPARAEVRRRRARFLEMLGSHAAFALVGDDADDRAKSLPYMLVKLPSGVDDRDWARHAQHRHDVLVSPGTFLDAPGCVRVSVSAVGPDFDGALRAFDQLLAADFDRQVTR